MALEDLDRACNGEMKALAVVAIMLIDACSPLPQAQAVVVTAKAPPDESMSSELHGDCVKDDRAVLSVNPADQVRAREAGVIARSCEPHYAVSKQIIDLGSKQIYKYPT